TPAHHPPSPTRRSSDLSAFLHRAVAMLGARARSHDHHRNAPPGRALAQLHHQLVTRHARHLEVGNDQMTAVLRHEFGSFEAVRRSEEHTSELQSLAYLV